MRLPRFGIIAVVTFLIVVILNVDVGFSRGLLGGGKGGDGGFIRQSQVLAQTPDERKAEADRLNQQGLEQYQTSRFETALQSWQQALIIYREIQDRESEGQSLNNLGLALFKSGNLTAAEETLLAGIQVWESIREKLGSNDAHKVSIFEEQARTYRLLQKVLIAQNKTDAALEISERGRARAFVELLRERLLTANVATDLVTDVTDDLSVNSVHPSSVTSIAPSATSAIPSVATSVTSATPSVATSVANIKQTAQSHNATLVEYSIIYDDFKLQNKQQTKESELYIWVIKPTGEITFRQADLKPLWQQQDISLTDLVYTSRNSIGVRGRGGIGVSPDDPNQTQRLRQLHQLLIEPIADLLPTDPNPTSSLTEREETRGNGLLTADEIFDLKLNAELVVLSACDTGQGRVTGDGVIGLSRSLISAGVPSVIVSLWSVSDDSTALILKVSKAISRAFNQLELIVDTLNHTTRSSVVKVSNNFI